MVFLNATFNYISVILWRSVLLVEETGPPRKNHQSVASHWPTLPHVILITPHLSGIQTHVSGDSYWMHRYSQICLSEPLRITTSFVIRPYLFLPSVFPCIWPLYNNPLSNVTNYRVLWVKILHITTFRRLSSNRKIDNK